MNLQHSKVGKGVRDNFIANLVVSVCDCKGVVRFPFSFNVTITQVSWKQRPCFSYSPELPKGSPVPGTRELISNQSASK